MYQALALSDKDVTVGEYGISGEVQAKGKFAPKD